MGNILVLYHSATGNTKKMAALVAEGAAQVHGSDVRVRAVGEATKEDVIWCEGIAVGSPTNMGVLSWQMKKFWDDPVMTCGERSTARSGVRFLPPGVGVAAASLPVYRF